MYGRYEQKMFGIPVLLEYEAVSSLWADIWNK